MNKSILMDSFKEEKNLNNSKNFNNQKNSKSTSGDLKKTFKYLKQKN